MQTLLNLFEDQLQDIYDAEHRISEALPKMVVAATCHELKEAFQTHQQETVQQIAKLKRVFEYFAWSPQRNKCEAAVGLLDEGEEIAEKFEGSPAINAALIAAAQKIEHYEIATYGCLEAWAILLEKHDAAKLLKEILDEEQATNTALNDLSEAKNEEALGELVAAEGDYGEIRA